MLATCPDLKLRDPKEAVAHAQKAVELEPDQADYWNTLGVARYRNGNWKSAIEALMKSAQLRNGGDSFDFFFLAMAHWKLNEKEKARAWYDQAVDAGVDPLEVVMVDEQPDPLLRIAQVEEDRALDALTPQGAPEAFDLT